jgi:hypothetical protein
MAVGKTTTLPPPFDALDKGIVQSNCCVSCPCDVYILASIETYLKFAEATGAVNSTPTTPDLEDNGIQYRYTDCNNGFKTCVDELEIKLGSTYFSNIVDRGIIEAGKTGAGCGFCDLLAYLDSQNITDPADIYNFFVLVLDRGLVIDCNLSSFNFIMASAETYLKYAEAVGLTRYGSSTITCCVNYAATTETYLKYAEAVGLTQSAAVPA